jgi:uncharacterized protein (DUF2141 family)
LLGAVLQPGGVSVTVTGVRSAKGQVLACLTALATAFPDCRKDPHARAITVPAGPRVELDFGEVPAGRYAISLFHDENGDGRLGKALMVPSEGYGFSRDAPVVMGPPSFAKAAFVVDGGEQHQAIRMRYIF